MASITQNTAYPSQSWFGRILRQATEMLDEIATASGRVREIERLQNMSDAELAKRGLTRDGIVHFVFRDTIGL